MDAQKPAWDAASTTPKLPIYYEWYFRTGENAALRINAMATKADNNGAGSSIDKHGLAGLRTTRIQQYR